MKPTKENVAETLEAVTAFDLPDGAHWQMCHDMLDLEYGELFPLMEEYDMFEKEDEPEIHCIIGMEPRREDESPMCYAVDFPFSEMPSPSERKTVTTIILRESGWFDILAGEELLATINANAVAEIHYKEKTND